MLLFKCSLSGRLRERKNKGKVQFVTHKSGCSRLRELLLQSLSHNSNGFSQCRCHSGFGAPRGFGPPRSRSASGFGPPLSKSASGYGPPLADLDPLKTSVLLSKIGKIVFWSC